MTAKTPEIPKRVNAIDWHQWKPKDRATLMFVIQNGRALLIRKKRGLGAGKINAAGGRIDPGETPHACAVREIKEELCIDVTEARCVGEHRFQFVDGYSLHVHVFMTNQMSGTPTETDEAIPLWFDVDAIPYDEMWEDDQFWVPAMLEGKTFQGWWIFDGNHIVDQRLIIDASDRTSGL